MVIDVSYTEFLCILFESRHITCLYVYNIRKLNNYASRNSNASKDSPQLEIVFYTNENCIIGHLQLDFYGVEFSSTDSMGFFNHFQTYGISVDKKYMYIVCILHGIMTLDIVYFSF